MFGTSRLSRNGLHTGARTLVSGAAGLSEDPDFLAQVQSVAGRTDRLARACALRNQAAQLLNVAAGLAEATGSALDQRVVQLSLALKLGRTGDDGISDPFLRLFPHGPAAFTGLTGRPQLTAYEVFAVELAREQLPTRCQALAGQVLSGIHDFSKAMVDKEAARQAFAAAVGEAVLAETALREALAELELIGRLVISPAAMKAWGAPVRAMGRPRNRTGEATGEGLKSPGDGATRA